MSDSPDAGNRVTMAQVWREVDGLGKRVDAHFDGVKERLDSLKDLPKQVSDLSTRVTVLEEVDSSSERRLTRNIALTAAFLSAAGIALNLLT